MRRLAVIPSDPIEEYKSGGVALSLEDYYNPCCFFDEVYLLSPLEKEERHEFGMKIIPTGPNQLKDRIKELNLDVVRAYGGYWPCDMACNNKVNGVPVVVSVHDIRPERLHDTIRKADVVFCVSETAKKLVLSRFRKPDRVWMLPSRVNFDVMRPVSEDKLGDLKDLYPYKFRILHVGRKSEEKNLDTLVKALKILGDEYCLLAIGPGDADKYINLAKEEGVFERCYFIDSVKNEELPRYFSMADCMCNPSRSEAMSLALIEALACGALVITSSIAGVSVNIAHMKNGLIVRDHEDPKALADAVRTACNDNRTREALKNNARKSVARFEKRRIDELEVSYYRKILTMKQNGEFDTSFFGKIFRRPC